MKNVRIEKIADMVEKGVVAADIGTDHAFLPVLLVQNNVCSKVYACDIAEGPLQSAAETIVRYGFQDKIQTILCDGMKEVPSDTETAVIAGMGYYTAVHILEDAWDRLFHLHQIIVEVNRDEVEMRNWINMHHFTITEERTVYEKGHDYVIISFNTCEHESYSESEIICGTAAMQKDSENYALYVSHQISRIEKVFEKAHQHPKNEEQLRSHLRLWKNMQ
jgi:tRNA (adenine22-N1)-methyltransferase